VAFSPDGGRVETESGDNTARQWDAASGKQLAVLQGHPGGILSVAFGPDGGRVATASYDNTAGLWDPASGKPPAVLEGHTGFVRAVAFSPDGGRVATASDDGTARLWDPASAKQLAVLQGHTDRVVSVEFSPDGGRVATASEDGTARLWIARESPEDQEKRQRFWREQQAAQAEKVRRWFAAAFHLTRLIDAEPADPMLYARRCQAYAHQGQWSKAVADLLQGAALCKPADE
jgi:WD40 repeat protein